MPKIIYIEHNGTEHAVDAKVGLSVMQTARDHLVPGIVGECGGSCSCGTCHGYVDAAWKDKLPAKSEDEAGILEGVNDTQDNSRLTCQIVVQPELDGLVIRLPASQF